MVPVGGCEYLELEDSGATGAISRIMNPEPIRITRQELYHYVWSKTLRSIAEELGTSYVELVRACAVMNVPRPSPGHWENVRLGVGVQQASLPEAQAGIALETLLRPKSKVVAGDLQLPESQPVESVSLVTGSGHRAVDKMDPASFEKKAPVTVTRQELYENVWKFSLSQLANDWGTTYAQLVAACEAMNVPRPPSGHWVRLSMGQPVGRVQLPDCDRSTPAEFTLQPRTERKGKARQEAGVPQASTENMLVDKSIVAVEEENKVEGKSPAVGSPQQQEKALKESVEPEMNPESRAPTSDSLSEPETPKIVEYTRKQLYEAIWITPCIKLAASLGISDVALAKTCKRMGVPRPSLGYWARLAAGEKPPQTPLPPPGSGQDTVVTFDVAANLRRRKELGEAGPTPKQLEDVAVDLQLPAAGEALHPLAEKHKLALEKEKAGEDGFVRIQKRGLFQCDIAPVSIEKLCRVFHALFREIEARGYKLIASEQGWRTLEIVKGEDSVDIVCSEGREDVRREPTPEEKRKPSWTWRLKSVRPTGFLSFEVNAWNLRGRRRWTEAEGKPLEEVLGIVIEKVESAFRGFEAERQREIEYEKRRKEQENIEAEREAKEAERRAREEKDRKERERILHHQKKLADIAQARADNLALAANKWVAAQQVMWFVEKCEQQWRQAANGTDLSKAQLDWLAWARAEAIKILPSSSGYPDFGLDGQFDPAGIPIGGPYPDVRKTNDGKEKALPLSPPTPPEVKTVYVQQPAEFPYWALHRRR